MKKLLSLLLCMAMLSSFMGLCASADFTDGSVSVTYEDGQIVVSGTFSSAEAGENYKVILASYIGGNFNKIIAISESTAIVAGANTVSYSVAEGTGFYLADNELVKAYIWTEALEPVCEPAEYTHDIVTGPITAVPAGTKLNQNTISVVLEATTGDSSAPNVLDGKASTYWESDSGSASSYAGRTPKMLTLDLGEVKTISGIDLVWFSTKNGRRYSFCIQASKDGVNWYNIDKMGTPENYDNMIKNATTSTTVHYYSLGNVEARYIRYVGTGNTLTTSAGAYNQPAEINVYVR